MATSSIGGSKRGYVLADFSVLKREATSVREEPTNTPRNVYAESPMVKMKCKYCGYEWRQYLTPWITVNDKGVWCPECKAFLSLDKDKPIKEKISITLLDFMIEVLFESKENNR